MAIRASLLPDLRESLPSFPQKIPIFGKKIYYKVLDQNCIRKVFFACIFQVKPCYVSNVLLILKFVNNLLANLPSLERIFICNFCLNLIMVP